MNYGEGYGYVTTTQNTPDENPYFDSLKIPKTHSGINKGFQRKGVKSLLKFKEKSGEFL